MTWMRIATAAVLIPVVVAVVWWGSTGLVTALAGLVTLLALHEFFALGERIGLHGYRHLDQRVRRWPCSSSSGTATEAQSWTLGGNLRLTRSPTAFCPRARTGPVRIRFGRRRHRVFVAAPAGRSAAAISASAPPALLFVVLAVQLRWCAFDGISVDRPAIGAASRSSLVWAGDTLAYFIGTWFGRIAHGARTSARRKPGRAPPRILLGSLARGACFSPAGCISTPGRWW